MIGTALLATRVAGGGGTVVFSAFTGGEIAGTAGTVIGALGTVITLWLTIAASNRSKRRQYVAEIRQARADGADEERRATDGRIRNLVDALEQARHERDFFRKEYFNVGGRQLPPPREEGTS